MNKNISKKRREKKKELVYEWRRVAYFFQFFDVETSSRHLWEMLKLALTSEDDSGDINERSDMIFFYEYTKELFENIYILLQEKKKTVSKKSS